MREVTAVIQASCLGKKCARSNSEASSESGSSHGDIYV